MRVVMDAARVAAGSRGMALVVGWVLGLGSAVLGGSLWVGLVLGLAGG